MPADPGHTERFVVEAREHLAGGTSALIALERGEGEPQVHVEQLLRCVHSIKSGAGFTGRRRIEELTHALETVVENIRDQRVSRSPDVIDHLLASLDRVGALLDDLEHSEEADISAVLQRLRPLIEPAPGSGRQVPARTLLPRSASGPAALARSAAPPPSEFPITNRVQQVWQEQASFLYGVKLDWHECEQDFDQAPLEVARRLQGAGTVLEARQELCGAALAEGLPAPPAWYWAIVASAHGPDQFAQQLGVPGAAIVRLESVGNAARPARGSAGPAAPPAAGGSLRVSVPLIDRMMGLAGELVLVRNQALHSADPAHAPLRRLLRRLDSVTNELQDAALRMRMQPVSTLFDRFPRLVRDLARQLGKQIDIETTGTEVELDKTILELLADPLMHLVRNCCDHGIERPEQRVQAGKAPAGRISLTARQQRGQILIQIRDDGRGLDCAAIKRKVLQQGLKRPDELERLNNRQLYDLILLSGFSTAGRVTDLSGRGVGLDVVKTNLDQIGGLLEIDSQPGQGTAFTMLLPLTLAIVPCLLLRCGAGRTAIPQRDVEEIILLDAQLRQARIENGDGGEVLRRRGRLLPVIRLEETLSRRQPQAAEDRVRMINGQRGCAPSGGVMYVVVLKLGSQRFGLVVDEVLESVNLVVKPLHPLLRPLGVYAGSTILADGSVALILSAEGLGRQGGVADRPAEPHAELPPRAGGSSEPQTLLLFRGGPAELLALPLGAVQRVVRIQTERIEQVGIRELINVDGQAVNVLRPERFMNLSACPDQGALFLILPRHTTAPVGLLASEIVDTPTLALQLDEQACKADGILGCAMIRDQVAVFIDLYRLVEMWERAQGGSRPELPGPSCRRILVVEDTQFFRQLIASCLHSAGHDVVLAQNGREGLAKLAGEKFDLIVSDIEMPVLDGLSFAQQVRADARFEALPLLALTSLDSAEDRGRVLASGFDAHQVKLDRQRFLAAVSELLARGRSAAGLRGAAAHG